MNEEIRKVTESERAACEAAVLEKLGPDAPKPAEGSAGNSPYSPETVVFRAAGTDARGVRVALAGVCSSYDGAGHYKGRGRTRTVYVLAPSARGELAVCDASDRDASEIGASGLYLRPWATHEAEEKSRGLGLAADAMVSAFEKLGL
jgi:hypothetical protein